MKKAKQKEEKIGGGGWKEQTYSSPIFTIKESKQPHTCPVCFGKGIVPNNFYLFANPTWTSTNTAPETCRSCGGSGVVWG